MTPVAPLAPAAPPAAPPTPVSPADYVPTLGGPPPVVPAQAFLPQPAVLPTYPTVPPPQPPAVTVPPANTNGPNGSDVSAKLSDTIISHVDVDSWRSNGGMIGSFTLLGRRAIITHTPATLAKVEKLLHELENDDGK